MILGRVSPFKQAIISLELHGPTGQAEIVDAAIDTGYDGYMTVTPEVADRAQLPYRETRSYELGNGEVVDFPVHDASVLWDGQAIDVAIVVTDGGVLVGMSLLAGYTLFIDAIDGGVVRIEPRS